MIGSCKTPIGIKQVENGQILTVRRERNWLYDSLWRRANARNVSFFISLGWKFDPCIKLFHNTLIYKVVNSVFIEIIRKRYLVIINVLLRFVVKEFPLSREKRFWELKGTPPPRPEDTFSSLFIIYKSASSIFVSLSNQEESHKFVHLVIKVLQVRFQVLNTLKPFSFHHRTSCYLHCYCYFCLVVILLSLPISQCFPVNPLLQTQT